MPGFENMIGGGSVGWSGNPNYGLTDAPLAVDSKPPLGPINELALNNFIQPPRMDGPNSVMSNLALASSEGNFAALGGGFVPIMMAGGLYGWSASSGFQYIPPLFGNFNTYRLLSKQPTINLALSFFCDQIRTTSIRFAKRDDAVSDAWLQLIIDQVQPQLQMILAACLESVPMGFKPFEKVWSLRDKFYWCELRPMIQDYTQIWISAQNTLFAGLSYFGEEHIIPPNKCLVISNEFEKGPYGISALDRAYDPYVSWQRTRVDQRKLRDKLSGILPILKYPPGKQPDNPDTGEIGLDNSVIAQMILDQIGRGAAVSLPSVQFSANQIAQQPKLASTSLWELDFYDAGTLAPAQIGNLQDLQYDDALFFRALKLPERAGQAGRHGGGTNAESETQTESSVFSKEATAADIAYQLTCGNPFFGVRGLIDDILIYNFGQKAKGSVLMTFAPMSDYKLKYKADILKQALSQDTPAIRQFFESIDVNVLASDFGFTKSKTGWDQNSFKEKLDKMDAQHVAQLGGSGVPVGGSTKKPDARAPWVKKFAKGSK